MWFSKMQILHSTGLEFHEKLEEAEDLDEIIKLHQDYTNIIFDRCLLNKKVRTIVNTLLPYKEIDPCRIAVFLKCM